MTGDWGPELAKLPALRDVPEWKLAVVTDVSAKSVELGMQPVTDAGGKVDAARETGTITAENMKWAYRDSTSKRSTAKSP